MSEPWPQPWVKMRTLPSAGSCRGGGWAATRCRATRSLPSGCERLADHVTAPKELLRRLGQVAVADADNGQTLAVGQRLVTRDGRLRRWDGFIAESAGAAAAERLLRANRLAAIAAGLPALEQAVAKAIGGRDSALAAMEHCRSEAETARQSALAAERDSRDAARAIDAATAVLERIEAQRANFAQRQSDLEPVLEAVRDAVSAAQHSLAALPDPAALEHEVEACRSAAATAANAVAERRAEAATKAREAAADRERQSAAGREQAEWRKRQSDAEQRLASTVERQLNQQAERADLQKEPAELDQRIAELEQANDQSQVRIGESAAAEREAEEAVVAAGSDIAAANEDFANAREHRAAAAARAEAQQARSAELAQSCVERFECLPQRLPERLAFDLEQVRDPDAEVRDT